MRNLFSSSAKVTSGPGVKGLALLALAARRTFAVDPTVELNYTSYAGTEIGDGVTQWLGMRFAAPPLGDLRFRAPQDPEEEEGPVEADTAKPYCLGTDGGPPTDDMDEDCLFLNVYAPSNATSESKLPVFFFIQGGGFNTNGPSFNGSYMIEAADMDLVVVNFNYRVGPYGFLAGIEVEADGSTNNGLKDQRKAMEWVQSYISRFGGDPGHVTIGGSSAGAQSVDLHVLAYGGRDDGLFHATAATGQSFPPLRTVNESQFAYNNLVIRTGCTEADNTLNCLRDVNATALQEVNYNTPFPGAQEPPLYMYGPTLDFDFITDYSIKQYAEGKFVQVPAISGDANDEGTVFTPTDTNNISDSNVFLQNNFPRISLAQFKQFNALYPVSDAEEPTEDQGAYFRQAALAYGELRYICPTIYVSGVYANESIPNWLYRWNVQDPDDVENGLGVTHTVEFSAISGDGGPDSYQEGGVNAGIVPPTQAYWTSFIRTYDPNTYKLEASPKWEQFSEENYNRRMKFETNSTMTEDIYAKQLERCAFLNTIAVGIGQ